MTHRPEGARDKYACKFCNKVLLYATSIRKHAHLYHADILESIGDKPKLLCDVIRADTGIKESMGDELSLLSEKVNTIKESANEEMRDVEEQKDPSNYHSMPNPDLFGEIIYPNDNEDMGMDTVYLQSELSDNIPLVDEPSLDYFMNNNISKFIKEQ